MIWYAAAGISSDGNTVLSYNIKHVAAWSSFCAVCRDLSLKWERHHLLNKKGKVGRDDRLNTGGYSLLLLSAQPSIQSSCISAVSTWNGNCHLVGHRLKLSFFKEKNKHQSACMHYPPCHIFCQKAHWRCKDTLCIPHSCTLWSPEWRNTSPCNHLFSKCSWLWHVMPKGYQHSFLQAE